MKAICALLLTVFVLAEGYRKKGYYRNPYSRAFFRNDGGFLSNGNFDGGFIGNRIGGNYLSGGGSAFFGAVNPGFTGFSGDGIGGIGGGRFNRYRGRSSTFLGSYGGDDFGDDGFGDGGFGDGGFGDGGFAGSFNRFGSRFRSGRVGRYFQYGHRYHREYNRCKCQRKCGKYKIYVGKCKTCRKCKLVMCCRYWRPKYGLG